MRSGAEGNGASARRPSVLAVLSARRNRELMAETLRRHCVVSTPDVDDAEQVLREAATDLLVLDGRTLETFRSVVVERREREAPLLLPVLLVVSRRRVGMATSHLWRVVDDVLQTPIERIELQARIASLLRARHLSLMLHRQCRSVDRSFASFRTLAGGLAHDFNNLLGPILGLSELALLELPEGHPARPNLEQVLQAARRARDLARRFLHLGRKPRGRPRQVPLGRAVEEVAELIRVALPHDATLEVNGTDDAPKVFVDPVELHQVLTNLATNAVQAVGEGGRVVLRVSARPPGARSESDQPPAWAVVEVEDDGHGIAETDLERIFEPYFTTKREEEGTGLGLATAKRLVRSWGGEIEVESRRGNGTCFRLLLPLATTRAERSIAPAAEPRERREG